MDKDELMIEEGVNKLLEYSYIEKKYNHFLLSDKVIEDINAGLYLRTKKVCEASISYFFLEYLNNNDVLDTYLENNNDSSIDSYRDSFLNELNEILNRVPSLSSKIKDTYETYQNVIDEMFERLDGDYDQVCGLLDDKFNEVTGLKSDSGDVHNHGHCTMIIETDKGKIVYKPHDVSIDNFGKELFERFFSDITRTPDLVMGDGYGFVEFIDNKIATDDDKAREYFYNLGGLSAIVDMLGSSDLHHNNILVNETNPIVIDYELLITPGKGYTSGLMYDLDHSLLSCSLMPCRRGDSEMSILFALDDDNKCSPVIDGNRKCINDYPEEFFDGFETIYNRCIERREEIKEFYRNMKDVCVRHIYRNTRTYVDLLEKTYEPVWLNDDNVEDILYEQLSLALKRDGNTGDDKIALLETKSIIRGDIPYLYMKAGCKDLYMEDNVVYPDFFKQSCLDNLIDRIDYLSKEDLVFEKKLLNKAMTSVIRANKNDYPVIQIQDEDISNEELLSYAEKIFEEIYDSKMITPSGEQFWFTVDYFLLSGMEVMGNGLINGYIGLMVFYAALSKYTKNEDIRNRCLKETDIIFNKLENYIDSLSKMDKIVPNRENISFSSGLAGKIQALYITGHYLNDDRYMNLIKKIIPLINKMDLSYEKIDIYNGLAGLLKVLCLYDDVYEIDGVKEICNSLSDIILNSATIDYKGKKIWRTLSVKWAISGAGHGQSGMASALYLAGKRLNRNELIDAAMAGFEFENDSYSYELCAWPDKRRHQNSDSFMSGYCSGAPGIGMNALNLKYDGYDFALDKAIESVMKQPLQVKDILCCGNCAIVEFLLEAGMRREARSRMNAVIKRNNRDGHYTFFNEGVDYVYSPSLFYGAAGLGYTMLRLIDPEGTMSVLL